MGVRIVFRETGRENGGERLVFDAFVAPGEEIAKPHVHPRQEEQFEVLTGSLRGKIGHEEREAHAGDTVVTPPGVPHMWWNVADEEAHLRVEMRPALTTDVLFERVFELAREGRSRPDGTPGMLDLALLHREHSGEFYASRPPVPVQRGVLFALYPAAMLLASRRHRRRPLSP
jgi:quercetin dioxygenase-like cupin family protein